MEVMASLCEDVDGVINQGQRPHGLSQDLKKHKNTRLQKGSPAINLDVGKGFM